MNFGGRAFVLGGMQSHPVKKGPPPKSIVLSAEERQRLEELARRSKTSNAVARRARIVLAAADGFGNHEIAGRLSVGNSTVVKWRTRFVRLRMNGIFDEPRVGAPRKISDSKVEEVVTKTLEETPRGETHWSRRSMARVVGLSPDSIGRIWRAFGLQPHLSETFKLSPDPQFIEKVRDIVGLYLSPPVNSVVFCVDEKSQIQALERTQPLLPMRPGQLERRTHDYARHGTTTLFAALNVATGEVLRRCEKRHRQQEYLRFLNEIDASVPKDLDVHLVVDNYSTHKTPRVVRWFAKRPRFHVHFTPTYSSWINQVERLFAELTNKAIRRGSFRSVQSLETAIHDYLEARPNKPFAWTATADDILASIERFCLRTSRPGH
jgi:transposase